jgi:hypothetical protein
VVRGAVDARETIALGLNGACRLARYEPAAVSRREDAVAVGTRSC